MSTTTVRADEGTTGATTGGPVGPHRIPGWLSAEQLLEAPVYFVSGPTGRSGIWPEQLAVLMYGIATTDPGFNEVDVFWIGETGTVVYVEVKATKALPLERQETVQPLDEVVRTLRAQLGMAADDVATMCGVGRRQLYNLMSGSSTRTAHEAHIRRLGDHVNELSVAVNHSPRRLRSVALHPVGGKTFYEAARDQDAEAMSTLCRRLATAVKADQLGGAIRRPSPRRGGRARRGAVAELYGDDVDA